MHRLHDCGGDMLRPSVAGEAVAAHASDQFSSPLGERIIGCADFPDRLIERAGRHRARADGASIVKAPLTNRTM
jgi:hypothetical protein